MLKMHELILILLEAHTNFTHHVRLFNRMSSAYYNSSIFFFVYNVAYFQIWEKKFT